MQEIRGKKVFVGLSGGVDSAVSAALLLRAGGRVTGVFIQGWYPPGMPCTWAEDRRDAMRVAARLGIPFITLDASQEYKNGVIDYLLREYAAGRTPNPDVMCNRDVKFGAFYAYAREHGADFIATGHYARMDGGKLLRGIDDAKDQSYFLWAVPQDPLAHTIFPVGAMRKGEVRALAKQLNLPVSEKRDSQGICFLGSVSVEEFLMHEIGATPGVARDEAGNEVGKHAGALLATIGQRVALTSAAPGPWYAIKKDMQKNELVVGKQARGGRKERSVRIENANWLARPDNVAKVSAQYRYHGPRVPGTLSQDGSSFTPDEPLDESPAPGQSLVFYEGEELIGGGIIADGAGTAGDIIA